MKLLLVEDNRQLAGIIKKSIGKKFIVVYRRDGEEGLAAALAGSFDIIILDLGLPGKSGQEICRLVRASGVLSPILILTGNDDVQTKVTLFDAGADDYLAKPFHLAELQARLNALLRRPGKEYCNSPLQVNDLIIDSERRRAQRQGMEIRLRRKEFDLLECLARNRGRPVSRATLLDYAWDGTKDTWNNTVDVHIKLLRDKIDKPFNSRLIRSAYGIGYVINDD